jgi:hypothetical protein
MVTRCGLTTPEYDRRVRMVRPGRDRAWVIHREEREAELGRDSPRRHEDTLLGNTAKGAKAPFRGTPRSSRRARRRRETEPRSREELDSIGANLREDAGARTSPLSGAETSCRYVVICWLFLHCW